ncbi:MAG: S1C family serine protease [Oscillospiraceae bacterium]|nr:S1C family serine protease [Oscillospiraceae bacterium]
MNYNYGNHGDERDDLGASSRRTPDPDVPPMDDAEVNSIIRQAAQSEESRQMARFEADAFNSSDADLRHAPDKQSPTNEPIGAAPWWEVKDAAPRAPEYREPSYREAPREAKPEPAYSPQQTSAPFYVPARSADIRYVDGGGSPEFGAVPPAARRRRGGFGRAVAMLLLCALIGAGSGAGFTYYAAKNGLIPAATPVSTVVLGAPGGSSGDSAAAPLIYEDGTMSAEAIYTQACDQVVIISSEVVQQGFFGTQSGTTYGSGFIISEDGYIVTNYHVVESAHSSGSPIKVTFYDGKSYDAKLVGYESDNDVAVLKIEAAGLSPVKIGSSAALRVGNKVYAVGNPQLLNYTMTDGIVSSLDRAIQVEELNSITMFQISAAVNSGNSGGPVYNSRGEVVGVVSAKYASEGVEGLGFAIPIDDAMRISTDLITNGYVTGKAKIGITGRDVDARTAEYYGWTEGVVVRTVEPGSAAEKAGVLMGDTVIGLGEDVTRTMDSLNTAKKKFKPGETTTITVVRNGQEVKLSITFDEATNS